MATLKTASDGALPLVPREMPMPQEQPAPEGSPSSEVEEAKRVAEIIEEDIKAEEQREPSPEAEP